ncbi:MAG: RNA polymerase sigma factor [Acidobacteria bacterium]|nr:RNA polymerase sigma factor [Acidobacteriota bacterium]
MPAAAGALPREADRAEFGRLVEETRRIVFQVAWSVLRNAADAEEVAQETYLRAFRRLGRLRDPGRFRAWVARIALRLALNRRRALGRRRAREVGWHAETFPAGGAVAPEAPGRLDLGDLGTRIDRLPGRYRTVLLMSAVEGMTAKEVAAVLGIRAGTVRSRLHEARRRLLEEMER